MQTDPNAEAARDRLGATSAIPTHFVTDFYVDPDGVARTTLDANFNTPHGIYSGPTSSPQVITPCGWFAPRPRRDGLARSWSNGYSFITPKDKPGLCSLKVVNGTDRDAVVKMVSARQIDKVPAEVLCRFVYICTGKFVTIKGIGAGDYQLFFCTGTHWDKPGKRFMRPHAAQKFTEVMKFTQEHKAGSIQYSANEVTLHPVVGGSARTGWIDQEEFDRLM